MHEFDDICYGKTVEELQIIISRELKVPSWNIRQVCIRNRNHSSGHHSYHGVIYKFEADVIKNRTSKNIL